METDRRTYVHKSSKAIEQTWTSYSMENEKRAAQVGFKPTTYVRTTYEEDVLPTELPRQLSYSWVESRQYKARATCLT